MSRTARAIVIAASIVLPTGCNSAKTSGAIDGGPKVALEELGQTLKMLAGEGRKAPTKPAELDALEPMMSVAVPMIRSGDLVYVLGAGYVAGGTQVVAYQKQAAAEGGFVLLQDGTVKNLSAAEFGSAPKAK